MTWVRDRLRSRCRLARTFSTAAWSSARTTGQAADRSAATATDRASFGSFLFTSPAASSRTRAASLGCTSSTRSPAATSCWASRCPSPPAPSIAQVRSGPADAQASSRWTCTVEARTRTSPSAVSAWSITTAVCDPLCGSTPIITAAIDCPFLSSSGGDPWRACLIPDPSARSHLFRATPRQGPTGWHIVLKPGHSGRQAVREPAHRTPQRYEQHRSASREQLGGSARGYFVFGDAQRERGGVIGGGRVRDMKGPAGRLPGGAGVHGVGGVLIPMR